MSNDDDRDLPGKGHLTLRVSFYFTSDILCHREVTIVGIWPRRQGRPAIRNSNQEVTSDLFFCRFEIPVPRSRDQILSNLLPTEG